MSKGSRSRIANHEAVRDTWDRVFGVTLSPFCAEYDDPEEDCPGFGYMGFNACMECDMHKEGD